MVRKWQSIVYVPVDVRDVFRLKTPCTLLIDSISEAGTKVEFNQRVGVAVSERSQCLLPDASICTDEFAVDNPVVIVAALSVDDVPKTDVVRIFDCLPATTAI